MIVGVSLAIDYSRTEKEILERLKLQASQTISTAITDLENLLDGAESSAWFVANIISRQPFSEDDLRLLVKDILLSNDSVFGATIALNPHYAADARGFSPYYFRRDGILRFKDLVPGDQPYWEREWFAAARDQGRAVWSEPYFDAEGGEVLMTTFSVPVFRLGEGATRELFAVVTADVALDSLDQYLQGLRLGNNGFSFLLSGTGAVLSAPDDDDVLQHYRTSIAGEGNSARWEAMLSAAMAGEPVSTEIPCPEIAGVCTIRISTLQATGWPVGILYSQDEMLEPLKRYQQKTAVITGISLLVLCLGIWIIVRRLMLPLRVLATATDQVARGELDASLPPIRGKDEIASLINSFGAMKTDLASYIANLEAVTASRSKLEGELKAAREIQMAMLPGGGEAHEQGTDYALWARVRPARSVGGDLYMFFRSKDQLFVSVGDVSDKGVPAALFMARAISLLQQLARSGEQPDAAMASLNDALESGNESCMFVTLFLGVLDLHTRVLTFASAGHTPPVLVRENRAHNIEQDAGPALGLAAGLAFARNRLQLAPGDRLAIYTDGIDEAFDANNRMFGTDRILRALEQSTAQPALSAGPELFAAVDTFTGDMQQSDDITLLLLDIATDIDAVVSRFQQTFRLGTQLSSRAGSWLEHLLEQAGTPPDVIMEMVLVQEELVTNVDKYAGLAADDELEVRLELSASQIVLTVSDTGVAFNPLTDGERAELGADIDHARVGGLGVHLVTQLTDSQRYSRERDRNVLQVVRRIGDRAAD
jgi:sigma-B regulation protein RsbU (phosphoserine phosphatase)